MSRVHRSDGRGARGARARRSAQPLRHIVRASGRARLPWLDAVRTEEASAALWAEGGLRLSRQTLRAASTRTSARCFCTDGETGQLLAVMNASAITAIRTAAVSAVATKLLAREDAHTWPSSAPACRGRSHLEAIPLVRNIDDVRIVSRTAKRRRQLVRNGVRVVELGRGSGERRGHHRHRDQLAASRSSAATGSRTACTSMPSDPASPPRASSTAPRSRPSSLFVDRRESTINESGDYLFALREGAITGRPHSRRNRRDPAGRAKGGRRRTEITLFKSLGLAVEDLASAQFLYEKAARARGRYVGLVLTRNSRRNTRSEGAVRSVAGA